MRLLDFFSEVVIADSEFRQDGRGGQEVRCIVAKELRSQNVHRMWIDSPIVCPYPVGADALFVAHYAVLICSRIRRSAGRVLRM